MASFDKYLVIIVICPIKVSFDNLWERKQKISILEILPQELYIFHIKIYIRTAKKIINFRQLETKMAFAFRLFNVRDLAGEMNLNQLQTTQTRDQFAVDLMTSPGTWSMFVAYGGYRLYLSWC